MALSMDEQRVLAEIERRLAAEDPGLAACLTAFRRPGPATMLRSPRARIIGSLFTVVLVAMVSLMVYAMIPFRGHSTPKSQTSATSTPLATSTSAARGQVKGAPAESMGPSSGTGIRAARPAGSSSGAAARAGQAAGGRTAGGSGPPTASGPLPKRVTIPATAG